MYPGIFQICQANGTIYTCRFLFTIHVESTFHQSYIINTWMSFIFDHFPYQNQQRPIAAISSPTDENHNKTGDNLIWVGFCLLNHRFIGIRLKHYIYDRPRCVRRPLETRIVCVLFVIYWLKFFKTPNRHLMAGSQAFLNFCNKK